MGKYQGVKNKSKRGAFKGNSKKAFRERLWHNVVKSKGLDAILAHPPSKPRRITEGEAHAQSE